MRYWFILFVVLFSISGLFHAFDENRDNHIDFKEISCGLSACCRGPVAERQKCKTSYSLKWSQMNKPRGHTQVLFIATIAGYFLLCGRYRIVEHVFWRCLVPYALSIANGAWNYFRNGNTWNHKHKVLVGCSLFCGAETGNMFITSLFSLFQFASKCSMWTVMGFCLEMSSMKWWWPCWRCGRTIAQTHFL